MLMDDLSEINRRLLHNLWSLNNVKGNLIEPSHRLIIPQKRCGELRISEQESVILYCDILNKLGYYYYSVETPTEQVYRQSGSGKRSANTDLSLYIHDGLKFKKVGNIELKAHNTEMEKVKKDIEKIIREGITANWFHTLKNVRSNTLPSLFSKFTKSFKACSNLIDTDKRISILFCFCVLEKRWGCIKHFSYDSSE